MPFDTGAAGLSHKIQKYLGIGPAGPSDEIGVPYQMGAAGLSHKIQKYFGIGPAGR